MDGPFSPAGHPVSIGDRVTVGHQAILHACRIEDDCLIGMRATIMDGAVLKPRVVLAAGSLVPGGKVLEGGFLWVGSPARRARALTGHEIAHLEYSATHYARLKERHRAGPQ